MPHADARAALLRAALGDRSARTRLRLLDTVDSTNAEARRNAASDDGPVLFLARAQTAGRGRLGRTFFSPADAGLYLTLSLPSSAPPADAVALAAAAAVAAADSVEQLTGLRLGVKWVNDLYFGEAKAGGILSEAVAVPGGARLLVGIGINLTTAHFPDGFRAPAISLREAGGRPVPAALLAGDTARRLLEAAEGAPDGAFPGGPRGAACLAAYRSRSLLIGRTVVCVRGRETFTGLATGVGDDYALLLTRPDGSRVRLLSGEVSARAL